MPATLTDWPSSIAPNSELSFDIYVKDIWVNLHDRFSILDIVHLDRTVVGVGNYEQLAKRHRRLGDLGFEQGDRQVRL